MLTTGVIQAQTKADEPYPSVITAKGVGGEARIEVLGDKFTQLPSVASKQSRMVIYRMEDGRSGATSLFVDERYHASLVPGAWTQLCYRTGTAELAARQMQAVTSSAKDRYDSISVVQLLPGKVYYLRVDMRNGQPVLRPVSSTQAMSEIDKTREQIHTVSRVAQVCEEVTAAEPIQAYALEADTLFAFDRADRAGMTDAGTRAIDNLLSRLRNDYSRIDTLHLIGHADPLGQPARNERLALERAQTVRDYISQAGQAAGVITAEGRGSREPVVTACGNTPTPQAIACNQPNRRVAVHVTGTRR
jgi:outer membrane protein OmpA-like peptidoglycan-associated protein